MKKNLYILYAIAFLHGMVFYAPVAALYRQAQGVSMFQITLIESVSLALCVALEIPWGVVADRIGYKATMVVCCLLYAVSKVVFWRAVRFGDFLMERVLLAMAQAGLSGVDSSLLYLSCTEQAYHRAQGIYNAMGTAGLMIAGVAFSLLMGEAYRLAALMTAVGYALATLLAMGLSRPRPQKRTRVEGLGAAVRATFRSRELALFLVGAALLSETHQTVTVFLSQLQYSRCGLDSSAMGYLYVAAACAGVCAARSAAVTRRLGPRRTAALLSAAQALFCAVLAATRLPVASSAAILGLRVCNSLFQPLAATVQNRHVHARDRATALSVQNMLISCVAIVTNLLFGLLTQIGLAPAFLFGSAACVLAMALLCARRTGLLSRE